MSRKQECAQNYLDRYHTTKQRRRDALPAGSVSWVEFAYMDGYAQGHADATELIAAGEYPSLDPADPPCPQLDEWREYHDDRKVNAIKLYRARTGRTLVEACLAFGHIVS